jgi:hypothetical protein
MKHTNEGSDVRVYPTLGVTLEAGASYDDATAKINAPKDPVITPSASSDSTVEEVK